MDNNYFIEEGKESLLSTYMIELIEGLISEREIEITSQDHKNEVGQELTREWEDGKTFMEKSDILFENFGTEKEKEEYASWKSKINI